MGRNRGETRGGHPRRLRVRSSLITRYERLIHQFINTRTLTDHPRSIDQQPRGSRRRERRAQVHRRPSPR